MENLLEKLLEMEKEQQVDSAAGGDQPRRGPGGGARSKGAGEGRPLQQTLSHRHPHANRQVMLFYRANCQLFAVVLEYYSPQGAEVAVPAPPQGQVRVRGLQDGISGPEGEEKASTCGGKVKMTRKEAEHRAKLENFKKERKMAEAKKKENKEKNFFTGGKVHHKPAVYLESSKKEQNKRSKSPSLRF